MAVNTWADVDLDLTMCSAVRRRMLENAMASSSAPALAAGAAACRAGASSRFSSRRGFSSFFSFGGFGLVLLVGLLGLLGLLLLLLGLGLAVARRGLGGDNGELGADVDRLSLLDEDLGQVAGLGRRHFGVDLVGGDLEEWLVL